jgi:hypothetical protein
MAPSTWHLVIRRARQQEPLPYEWGLGQDVPQGENRTFKLQIRIVDYFEPTHWWVKLVQTGGAPVEGAARQDRG